MAVCSNVLSLLKRLGAGREASETSKRIDRGTLLNEEDVDPGNE